VGGAAGWLTGRPPMSPRPAAGLKGRNAAQEADMAATTTRIGQVRTIGIPVDDQERALAFYRDRLGFEVRMDSPFGDGGRWLEVAPPAGATSVALVQTHDDYVAGVDTGIRLTTDDAAAVHAALAAEGVDVAPDIIPFPVPMFFLSDPDGNRLVIVEQRTR